MGAYCFKNGVDFKILCGKNPDKKTLNELSELFDENNFKQCIMFSSIYFALAKERNLTIK